MNNFSFPNLPNMGSPQNPSQGYGASPTLGFGSTIAQYGVPAPVAAPPVSMTPSVPTPMTPSVPGVAAPTMGAPAAAPGAQPGAADFSWNGLGNAAKNTLLTKDGGLNLGNIGSIAQTLGAFGQMWSGIQANRIARDTLDYQKSAYKTNLENQTSSYNLALEDRITSRYAQQGNTAGEAKSYIDRNKLGG